MGKGVRRMELADILVMARPGHNDCVEWPYGVGSTGYGKVYLDGKHHPLHRWVYAQFHDLPPSEVVMHSCDNRRCFNTRHLSAATQQMNVQDMHRKGRANTRRGEAVPTALLTADDVREIRRLAGHMTQEAIAARYGIRQSAVSRIVHRLRWAHVPDEVMVGG